MSKSVSKTDNDESFDAIMENSWPTEFFRFWWTVKDFNKYPSEDISSHEFYPTEYHLCKFELCNFTLKNTDLKNPVVRVEFHCENKTYITINLSFSDSNGKVLYELKSKLDYFDSEHDEKCVVMENFPREISEMSEDTVIIRCQMEISKHRKLLETPKIQKDTMPSSWRGVSRISSRYSNFHDF
ncbi:unnamed protein product [Larinioides sclopetarius]|uniref:MATH domain-containing protein n=1 Tax=Larinioides sclopetarius TaxID=280406 RepID=A0AAV2BC82_9ARAC